MKLQKLDSEKYKDYEFSISYESDFYYDLEKKETKDGFSIKFVKKPFKETFFKDIRANLFKSWWTKPEAYAIFEEKKIVGLVEFAVEDWNNRLRITNISINKAYRRQGWGKIFIDKAKEIARERNYRAIVLETQSCNFNAIQFYLSQGFELGGYNCCEYSNNDVKNKEIRLEMVQFVK